MTDTVNETKKVDEQDLERDVHTYLQSYKASGKRPDFAKMQLAIYKMAKASGISEKGAKAWASLKMLDVKKAH